MNLLVWLVVGGVIGWVASTINQSDFGIGSLLVSLVGAVILLAAVNLFRRGSVR